ncbi:MAG: TlpA family protein disulfide reductase [Bacteroidales bacterium]|nr:TlpA family protein disulfide reductase [Bacteroidales bacterium]
MTLVIKWWRNAFFLCAGLSAMVSCSTPNRNWESNPDNDRIVHVCGTIDHLSPRDVRICLAGTDYTHSDSYYTIPVKEGRFSSDVPLNPEQVYELLIPWEEHYHSCRYQVFFACQDTLRFIYDAREDNYAAPDLILNPEGSNSDYLAFKAEKARRFAEERKSLQEEYQSIKDNYWSAEFESLNQQMNDRGLDRYARDSIKLLLGQMCEDRTAYTPEGRAYLAKNDQVEKMGLDFAKDYLSARLPSLGHFEIAYESIQTASAQDYDYQAWLKTYEQVYADKFEKSNLHQLVSGVIAATSVREGGRFVDFTLPDKDGVQRTLSQLIGGKYAVLEFWATWCSPCITTRHTIRELYDQNRDKDFTVVGVAREFRNDSKWRSFIEKDGAGWTDLLAMEEYHSVGDAYGLREKAGSVFLIDKEGIVIKINPAREEIQAVLDAPPTAQ